MAYREPREIEQCIGCGEDVAVYSVKQLVDGDWYSEPLQVLCPRCRRLHRKSEAEERKKRAAKKCVHWWEPEGRRGNRCSKCGEFRPGPKCEHEWVEGPTGKTYCRICLVYPHEAEENPLDPYAYDVEPHPFSPKTGATREQQLGVHTTPEEYVAVLYAIQRASEEITVLDVGDPYNCGVVFELDTTGLDPLPDVDAAITAAQNVDVVTQLLDEPGVAQALWAEDAEQLADMVEEYVESTYGMYDDSGWPPSTYTEAAWREIERQHSEGMLVLLRDLPPEELLHYLEQAREEGNVSLELWMEVVGQRRYLSKIDFDRLRSVQLVRPVRWQLWGELEETDLELGYEESPDWAPDEPDMPQIFAWPEDFSQGDVPVPDMVEVFKQKTSGRVFEYHGTDLTRARVVFPELAKALVSPWPYTQE